MSSSYGRPSPGKVSVSAGSQRSNTPSVKLPSGSTVTENAPYRDYRDPRQASKNVEIKNQAINNLIEFATGKEVQQFAITQFDNAAKREAGKAIDAYPGIATTSGGNDEAIDAYNSLSPRAKDFVVEAQTANALSNYGEALEGAYLSEPILYAAGNTPEQQELRAAATARAQAKARDVVGLSRLPSYQIAQNAQKLADLDGAVKGQAYKMRMSKEADLARVKLIDGGTAVLRDSWPVLNAAGASDQAGDKPLTVGLEKTYEGIASTLALNLGPNGQAMALAGAIGRFSGEITDPTEELEFLQRTLKTAQTQPLLAADGETNLWEVPLVGGKGKTIREVLEETIPSVEQSADKAIMGKAFLQALKLEKAGNTKEARDLMLQTAELLNDQSAIPVFISQMDRLTTRVDDEMRQRDNQMFLRQLDGESAGDLVKEMIASDIGTYSPQAVKDMFALARKGEQNTVFEQKEKEYQTYKGTTRENYDVALSEYASATGVTELYVLDPNTNKPVKTNEFKKVEAQFDNELRLRFFDKKDNAIPKDFDPRIALQESYEEVVAAQKAKAPAVKPVSPVSLFNEYTGSAFKALRSAASANGGKISSENIPAEAIRPERLKAWQAANPNKNFDSLAGIAKERLMVESYMSLKKFDKKTGEYRYFTQQEAEAEVNKILGDAEKGVVPTPKQRVPETVPVKPPADDGKQYVSPAQKAATELLEQSVDYIKQDGAKDSGIPAYEGIKQWFNNNGFGPQSMSYVNGFLNMIVGAAPATAGELAYGTPEGLEALRQSWKSGQRGLSTPPLPQVAAATPVRAVPTAIGNDQHELFVMVGVAEGTRTASGGYTKAYYGHTDPGDGHYNRGTVSGGRGTSMSPEMVDQQWMGRLTAVQQRMRPYLIVYGLQPGTQGYNRMMFNLIDLEVQAPLAARDFVGKLPQLKARGWTVEAIAKARADSFINPNTGRLEASGFGNSYQRLMQDQRSRAGVYDYRRRI